MTTMTFPIGRVTTDRTENDVLFPGVTTSAPPPYCDSMLKFAADTVGV